MQKRFIEYDLPLADISEESAREKSAPLASTRRTSTRHEFRVTTPAARPPTARSGAGAGSA